jgi:hypothetical protein
MATRKRIRNPWRPALAGVLLSAISVTGCAVTVPSQRLQAIPAQGQALAQYKQDSWECDNYAVQQKESVSSYWWAGLIGMAIAKSNIEGKEEAVYRACMEAKSYRLVTQ